MNPTLLGFIRKELVQALRDKRMRVLIFVLPVMQMTLFGIALRTETRNIPLAVQYTSAGRMSDPVLRQIESRALASGWFIPASVPQGDNEPFHWVQRGSADAVLVAPVGGVTRSMERGEGRVQLLINAVNVVQAQQIQGYMQSVVSEVLRDRYGAVPSPLNIEFRILYNPALVTAVYMVPGVMSMVLCILTIILTAMAITREKELGTFEMLISAPVKTWEILLGKTLPFVLLGIIDVPIILTFAVLFFDVPMRGSLLLLLLSAFAFVWATVSIGTLVSTISRTQQQAMLGSFLILLPAIMLSGVMFPVENMPKAMQVFAYINPLKYFVNTLRTTMLKGGDPRVILGDIAVLTVMSVAAMAYAFKRFRHTLG